MNYNTMHNLMKAWHSIRYLDGLPDRITLSEKTKSIFVEVLNDNLNYNNSNDDISQEDKLGDRMMDGYSVSKLPRVPGAEKHIPILYSKIFNDMMQGNFFSPAYYAYKIIQDCMNYDSIVGNINMVEGVVYRGLRTLASLMREQDLKLQLNEELADAVIDINTKLDVADHTDLRLDFNGIRYNIWSYQTTSNALDNGANKLMGNRGEIPNGVHVLCPFDSLNKKEFYGWYFYTRENANRIVKKIKEYDRAKEADDYNKVIQNNSIMDVSEYMKIMHIFVKE